MVGKMHFFMWKMEMRGIRQMSCQRRHLYVATSDIFLPLTLQSLIKLCVDLFLMESMWGGVVL